MAKITWKDDETVLEELRSSKLRQIITEYEKQGDIVKSGYPESEILSWDKQEREAMGYDKDPSTETPFLDALANERGIDKEELVQRVIAKVNAYNLIVGTLTGKRQRLEDQINEATTIEELEQIVWE